MIFKGGLLKITSSVTVIQILEASSQSEIQESFANNFKSIT